MDEPVSAVTLSSMLIKQLTDMPGGGSLSGFLFVSGVVAITLLSVAIACFLRRSYILATTLLGIGLVAAAIAIMLLAVQGNMPTWVSLVLMIAGFLIFVSGVVMDIITFSRQRARGGQPQQEEPEPPA